MRGGGGGRRGVFNGVVGVLLLFVPFLSGGGAGTEGEGASTSSEFIGAGFTSSAENLYWVASTVSCHLMWIPSPAQPATDSARTLGKPW